MTLRAGITRGWDTFFKSAKSKTSHSVTSHKACARGVMSRAPNQPFRAFHNARTQQSYRKKKHQQNGMNYFSFTTTTHSTSHALSRKADRWINQIRRIFQTCIKPCSWVTHRRGQGGQGAMPPKFLEFRNI